MHANDMFQILEVKTAKDEQRFLDFARQLYAKDPEWVCPLDMEIRNVFKPEKNAYFSAGEAARFIAVDPNGQTVGRIAAFYNQKKAARFAQPTGGCGFFECIDNQAAANALFDAAKHWLQNKGMEAMDGPVNFGENDRFWGLLVEGYTQPAYGMPYNKKYYQQLFENYGFTLYFKQSSKLLDLRRPMPERFEKIYDWVKQKEGVRFENIRRNDMMKYGRDLMAVYNEAWKHHEHFTPLTEDQIAKMVEDLGMIIIEEMIVFAYVDNQPAGFLVCLPDLNQIFKPWQGKMGLVNTLLFLWRKRNQFQYYRRNKTLTRGRVLIMGVHPKFQRYGIESGLILSNKDKIIELGFEEIELSWVGDFNPKMQAVLEATEAKAARTHHTYRYLFNQPGGRQYAQTIVGK